MNQAEFYLEDLKSKFSKIDPTNYYLAYSGGRDSHFLLWFIREYLHETRIPAVFSNTGMEIGEIRDRALAYSDVVLKPVMKHFEIKEKFGIPLNTKLSDEWVYRYQTKIAQGYTNETMPDLIRYMAMRDVNAIKRGRETGQLSKFCVNKKTSQAMIEGKLHKVSNKCCTYLKKKPAMQYVEQQREHGKTVKPILGVMGTESISRKSKYTSCFLANGTFTPIWDLSEELRNEIEAYCGIQVPKVYEFTTQTGCAGCPYGQHGGRGFGNTNIELNLCGKGHREFILEYFKESYAFKGYLYQPMLFV